ncbi:MAG: murein L,D-transpeptidase family protein [Alphaproteobacteria bacterium]|nr:murein L,D-transpeptidase family protein [Alphaproteobacteria bacterium]
MIRLIFITLFLSLTLTACQQQPLWLTPPKARQPLSHELMQKLKKLDIELYAPVLIRIFKKENKLEIWKQNKQGQFVKLAVYNICAWSGKLGPKFMEYDRQSPEGFYKLTTSHMNAYSHYYLAFDIGYPNEYDKAHGYSGHNLMIHGACSSSGCYSMSDKNMAQIYALVRDGFLGGQKIVQIHAFPFQMNAANMALYAQDKNAAFWQNLKTGYDVFNITHQPLDYDFQDGKYHFKQLQDPAIAQELQEYLKNYNAQFQALRGKHKLPSGKLSGIKDKAEASRVAHWMRRAIAGENVGVKPPNL